MKTFNAIQIVVLLMLGPSLLQLCKTSTFTGAPAVFWGGLIGFLALAVLATALIRIGMGKN